MYCAGRVMSCGDGTIGFAAETDALREAEVDRFLKSGILDNMLEVCEGGGGDDAVEAEDGVDVKVSVLSDEVDSIDVSEPVRDSSGWVDVSMSPENWVARRTASACETPAKATTVRSGR